MIMQKLLELKEFNGAGLYEEPSRSLFYKKALGLRRFYENCDIPEYHGELLFPSGAVTAPNYLTGLAINWEQLDSHSEELAHQIRQDFCQYHSSVSPEHSVAGNMYTHSMPNYERILKEGFESYIQRIQQIQDTDFKEGLLHLVEGLRSYICRCIQYLESVHAPTELVQALKQVPMHPARNIYEAVVAWNFILYLDNCDNLGCVASGLLPYYNGENIIPLLKNLFDNLDANNGYSMALGTDYSPLTLQCLEAAKGKRRPMIELFVDENTPQEVWDKAFEVIRTSNGQPAFYNPSALLCGLQKRFPYITDVDIKKFCGGGCTEAMLAGLSNVGSLDAGINLPLILENTIKTYLASSKDFDDFYAYYIQSVKEIVDMITTQISISRKERAKYNPLPMRTLLIDDCIDRGRDYNNGGARYNWSIINFAGMINVIDSMLVIRDYIFEKKIYTAEEFILRLHESDDNFLMQFRNHNICFGSDNTDANHFTTKISTDIFSMLDHKEVYMGEGFLPASIQFMSQVDAGKKVGATPDGRKEGAPLCDSLAAVFGKDTKGPTALLNSVTCLNLERVLGVPVLNFNINPDFRNEILKALILSYMKQGGIQIQITCISRQMLEEAYKNPEEHKNFVVRVGGYSEYFYRLSDELKRMVINRTIQNEV